MLYIGITGGMGSGKTVVCKIWQTFGVPIFDADAQTKLLYNTCSMLQDQLMARFGFALYRDGVLQTQVLAQLIFRDAYARMELAKLVYPLLWQRFEQWSMEQNSKLVAMEAALLCESGFRDKMSFVVNVTAPQPLRIERVRGRNPHLSTQDILQRMQCQYSEEVRTQSSNFTIINDGIYALLPQILKLNDRLRGEELRS